jgi:RNA polymerase sigma-54 factor
MLSLSQRQSLQQRLSPQQVQYLKMLQLPVIALEQRIKQEIEVNPMLEELSDVAQEAEGEFEQEAETVPAIAERHTETKEEAPRETTEGSTSEEAPAEDKGDVEWEEFFADQYDDYKSSAFNESDDEEQEEFPQRSEVTLSEQLLTQLRMQPITEDELALAEEIIGNIDEHGYLRRDLGEIVDDLNKFLSLTQQASETPVDGHQLGDGHFERYDEVVGDAPFGRERLLSHQFDEDEADADADAELEEAEPLVDAFAVSFDDDDDDLGGNGTAATHRTAAHRSATSGASAVASATATAPSSATMSIEEMSQLSIEDLARMLEHGTSSAIARDGALTARQNDRGPVAGEAATIQFFTVDEAEGTLRRIQRLDPPGIGARDLRECLLVQLEVQRDHTPSHELAYRIIDETYTEFTMKHFEKICDRLKCETEDLREAMEVIRGLNPKPGEGSVAMINDNYLTPDFVIERDEEDFLIVPNDRHIPTLRINRAYQDLMRRGKAKKNGIDRDTRKFLREKFEAAKWFIASIQQRRQTMMKVMRAIVDLQREFFIGGPNFIRPMIYKDVAERIGMDISTVCRVVNGKYVQTDYGTFELRYFFSEKLETTSGEEVSTKIVKARIHELIEAEDKHKPLSDDAISKMMKKAGFFVARRTVAKYREQMNIPVARLRRAL